MSGQEATKQIEIACEHCNLALRALRFLWELVSDEGVVFQDFEKEAESAHNILAVHVTEPDRLEEARGILADQHAHRIEYWGHFGAMARI